MLCFMEKKVWIIMESWREECHSAVSMGFVNSVYEDYKEAVKAQKVLVKYHKIHFPNDFYANWIVERMLFYAK